MSSPITVQRGVYNYALTPEENLENYYNNKYLKLLYAHFHIDASTDVGKVVLKVNDIEKTIRPSSFEDFIYNCQKDNWDELKIIENLKQWRKQYKDKAYIEIRPYPIKLILFDKGSPPQYAELIISMGKHHKFDTKKFPKLAQLIGGNEQMILEVDFISKPKKGKYGYCITERCLRKNAILQIDFEKGGQTLYLELKNVERYCHGLTASKDIFYILECIGTPKGIVIPSLDTQSCKFKAYVGPKAI